MKRSTLARFAVVLLLISSASEGRAGTVVQWQTGDGGNGHYYELVGDYLNTVERWTWEESKTLAENRTYLGLPGHLVTITSQAENDFIINSLHRADPFPTWLGLTDSEIFGGFESFGQPNPQVDGWVWVTGELVSFVGWSPGNPDNLNNEDFAVMGRAQGDTSLWNDVQSGTGGQAPFFVEYEPNPVPEPSTARMVFAFASSVAFFLAMRNNGARGSKRTRLISDLSHVPSAVPFSSPVLGASTRPGLHIL